MMLADAGDRARLGPPLAFAGGDDEAHLVADMQPGEGAARDAVFVEIDLEPVGQLHEPVAVIAKEFVDASMLRHSVPFDISSPLLRKLAQLARRRSERIADRDARVLVGVVAVVLAIDDDLRARDTNVEPHRVQPTLVVVLVWSIDRRSPAGDVGVNASELRGVLADARLDAV
jgi:hypothetical protein